MEFLFDLPIPLHSSLPSRPVPLHSATFSLLDSPVYLYTCTLPQTKPATQPPTTHICFCLMSKGEEVSQYPDACTWAWVYMYVYA